MKRIFFALMLSISISSYAQPPKEEKKELTVTLSPERWNGHLQALLSFKNYVDNSNLPNNDVKFIKALCDSLLNDFIPQLRKQVFPVTDSSGTQLDSWRIKTKDSIQTLKTKH